jgi:hypothetical protein
VVSSAGRYGQFDLQSLLWLTVTIGLALAYLRPLGHRVVLQAWVVIACAAFAALLVGTMRGRIGDVLYWSVLASAFAFISAIQTRLAHWTTPFAWAGLGAVTACAVTGNYTSRWLRPVAMGALAAGVVMGLYTAFLYRFTGTFDWFDLACCVPLGALFGLLVSFLKRLETLSTLRYDATATVLMAATVCGNCLSRLVAPMLMLAVLLVGLGGCGKSPGSTVDPAPFEAAIAQYLDRSNMAMKVKEIREGPTVTGDKATLTASLVHREMGGPSVVWLFEFSEVQPGTWRVMSHVKQ